MSRRLNRSGRPRRSRVRQVAEFVPAWLIFHLVRWFPLRLFYAFSRLAGNALFRLLKRRRRITVDNVRLALGDDIGGKSPERIARESFHALAYLVPEIVRIRRRLARPDAMAWVRREHPHLVPAYERGKQLHDAYRGCVFVTPHFGNWEALPFAAGLVGIPLVVVVRPLDNEMLERFLYASRRDTGQWFIPRRNSLLPLQNLLAQGKSVGILPDQSTPKGVPVPFLGRTAWTSPVPAILAVYQKRPIVVTACIRTGPMRFEAYLGDPILPREGYESEKGEIIRLTAAMNASMEEVIRAHPEQYFWMHNRWKSYDTRF